jgi:16S rRNA processing protein RimM
LATYVIFAGMAQYFNIGKFVATFGVDGQLVLQHVLGKKTALSNLTVVMVEVKKDDLLPYFVSATKIKNDTEVYITLEDIDSKEKAKRLTPRPVWLKEEDFHKYVAKSSNLSMLGYMLYDKEQPLSEIMEVIEQPHQLLTKIMYKEKEMLIPVNEAFIIKIDNKNKKIILDLPDGLLDIYL